MTLTPLLLVLAVTAVGVLHTIVPDHWLPIALVARERGWSKAETARVALQAGTGHVLSTLLIAAAVWIAGVAFADRFGHMVDIASSLALTGFGGWIALSAWRELDHHSGHTHAQFRGHDHWHAHPHPPLHAHPAGPTSDQPWHHLNGGEMALEPGWAVDDDPLYAPLRDAAAILTRHGHVHSHGRGVVHLHWHDHTAASAHPVLAAFGSDPPLHRHRHKTTARTAMLLILGSSPMVEGIPAFFAAGKYGAPVVAAMTGCFAASTIATYVVLCTYSSAGLQRLRLGALERYGEVLSGGVIAVVGLICGLWPAL